MFPQLLQPNGLSQVYPTPLHPSPTPCIGPMFPRLEELAGATKKALVEQAWGLKTSADLAVKTVVLGKEPHSREERREEAEQAERRPVERWPSAKVQVRAGGAGDSPTPLALLTGRGTCSEHMPASMAPQEAIVESQSDWLCVSYDSHVCSW